MLSLDTESDNPFLLSGTMGCQFARVKSHLLPRKHICDYYSHGEGSESRHTS